MREEYQFDTNGIETKTSADCPPNLLEKILNCDFTEEQVLQDKRKSFVSVIRIEGIDYVFKRNRFWTRKNETKLFGLNHKDASSFYQFKKMSYFYEHGVPTPKVFLAIEKKSFGIRSLSILIQKYEEPIGIISKNDLSDFPEAYAIIQKIHSLNHLHGDPGRRNFLKTKDGLKVIDYRAPKNWTGEIGTAFELLKLADRWKVDYPSNKGLGYYIACPYYKSKRYINDIWDDMRGVSKKKEGKEE